MGMGNGYKIKYIIPLSSSLLIYIESVFRGNIFMCVATYSPLEGEILS